MVVNADERSVDFARVEPRPTAEGRGPGPAQWIAAVLCILYGFAKLNGSQFTILDSELTKPLGKVSGFWLTWYYFGYSAVYGTAIALLQIGAGILLVLPGTALAGALLLLPIITNIILIDVLFGVDLSGTAAAVVLLICVLITITPHLSRLRRAVFPDAIRVRSRPLVLVVLVFIVVGAWGLTYWAANYNNRSPTPIDGIWSVTSQSGTEPFTARWQHVFFERNRAHMVVFRTAAGPDEVHHFEVDENGTVRIWQTWLSKGGLIMQGQAKSDGQVELEIAPVKGGGHLVLQRMKPEL